MTSAATVPSPRAAARSRPDWVNLLLALLLGPVGLSFTSGVLALAGLVIVLTALLWFPQVQGWHMNLLSAALATAWTLARPHLPEGLTRLNGLPWPKALALSAALLLVTFGFTKTVATAVRFGGPAMQPTLGDGQRVGVRLAPFLRAPVTRGTVVEFRHPQSGQLVISRVVALGGDTVELRRGVVYVGGQPVDDPARLDTLKRAGCLDAALPLNNAVDLNGTRTLTVPGGQLFMVMDNRNGLLEDSRTYGPVPAANVLGTVQTTANPRAVSGEACRGTLP